MGAFFFGFGGFVEVFEFFGFGGGDEDVADRSFFLGFEFVEGLIFFVIVFEFLFGDFLAGEVCFGETDDDFITG